MALNHLARLALLFILLMPLALAQPCANETSVTYTYVNDDDRAHALRFGQINLTPGIEVTIDPATVTVPRGEHVNFTVQATSDGTIEEAEARYYLIRNGFLAAELNIRFTFPCEEEPEIIERDWREFTLIGALIILFLFALWFAFTELNGRRRKAPAKRPAAKRAERFDVDEAFRRHEAQTTQSLPYWVYLAIGIGIVLLIAAILLIVGFFTQDPVNAVNATDEALGIVTEP